MGLRRFGDSTSRAGVRGSGDCAASWTSGARSSAQPTHASRLRRLGVRWALGGSRPGALSASPSRGALREPRPSTPAVRFPHRAAGTSEARPADRIQLGRVPAERVVPAGYGASPTLRFAFVPLLRHSGLVQRLSSIIGAEDAPSRRLPSTWRISTEDPQMRQGASRCRGCPGRIGAAMRSGSHTPDPSVRAPAPSGRCAGATTASPAPRRHRRGRRHASGDEFARATRSSSPGPATRGRHRRS